jgi:hypothetical protein
MEGLFIKSSPTEGDSYLTSPWRTLPDFPKILHQYHPILTLRQRSTHLEHHHTDLRKLGWPGFWEFGASIAFGSGAAGATVIWVAIWQYYGSYVSPFLYLSMLIARELKTAVLWWVVTATRRITPGYLAHVSDLARKVHTPTSAEFTRAPFLPQ